VKNNTTFLLAMVLVVSAILNGGLPQIGNVPGTGPAKTKGQVQNAVSDPFRFAECAIGEDDDPQELCTRCPSFCPAKGLLDTISSNFEQQGRSGEPSVRQAPWHVPQNQRANIDFVIATLPDPVHTHLSLMFDRHIEAIQNAAQSSGQGYLFSRAWMPWVPDTEPESTDFRIREQMRVLQRKKEDLPGVMIFRRERDANEGATEETAAQGQQASAAEKRSETKREFLIVLVVGETPTGGIRREQFKNALKMIQEITPDTGGSEKPWLRILGTTFSGSLESLNAQLRDSDLSKFSFLDIESGSATDESSIKLFKVDLGRLNKAGKPQSRFVAMQHDGTYVQERFVAFLEAHGYDRDEIASLSESETAYGRIKSPDQPSKNREPPHDEVSHHFYFPRDISQLRAMYQKEMQDSAKAADPKQAPRTSLPLNLDVTGNDDDSVTPYARLQTPLSQEAVMKGIVSNLRKHHTKIVILSATNILDSLFLCQYLRSAYPQGRLAVLGADRLLQQDPSDLRLNGVLAVTTYPLVPGIDEAIGRDPHSPTHADQVISDSYSVGVFNAMVSELSPPKTKPGELADPENSGEYVSYGWPRFAGAREEDILPGKPALWLVQIGKGGYWPIALLDEDQGVSKYAEKTLPEKSVPPQTAASGYEVSVGLAWKVWWVVSAVFLWGYLYLLVSPPARPRSEIGVTFALPGNPIGNGFLFIAGILLVLMQLCFLFPWISGIAVGQHRVLLILPLLSVAALCGAAYQGFWCRDGARLGIVLAAFAGATAFICLELAFAGEWIRAGSEWIFFARRFTHLQSGLSPAMPLLFLLTGFLWCCWYGMDGVQISRSGVRLLPPTDLFSPELIPDITDRFKLLALTKSYNEALTDLLRPLCPQLWAYAPALLVTVATMFFLRGKLPVDVVEPRGYVVLLSVLLGVTVFLFVFVCTRIVLVWIECKDLLRRLENLKLRRSFAMHDDFRWGTLWRMASDAGVLGFYQRVNREMECLRDFLRFDDAFYDRVNRWKDQTKRRDEATEAQALYYRATGGVFKTQEKLKALLKRWVGSSPQGLAEQKDKAQEVDALNLQFQLELGDTVGKILLLLNKEWAIEEPSDCTSGKDGKNDAKEAVEGKGEKPQSKSSPAPKLPEVACAERCVCLYFLNVILIVLRRIRSLVFALSGLFVFLVLALTSYPFEPHLQLRTGLIAMFLGALVSIAYVYSQIYRNATLSRVTATDQDKLGWDFWVRMAGFVAVPVLSLLAAQFPELNRFLFSWVQPALESVH